VNDGRMNKPLLHFTQNKANKKATEKKKKKKKKRRKKESRRTLSTYVDRTSRTLYLCPSAF